jgi:hypothetical protein
VLEQFRSDLRHRKNLDIYASIGIAVAASVTSAFDLLPPDKTTSAVMAVLAVLGFSMLNTRTAVQQSASTGIDRFRDRFDENLEEKRQRSRSLLLAGVSLSRTIETSYEALEHILAAGGTVRILLTDPSADVAALDARCQRSRPGIDEIRHEVEHSLRSLARLHRRASGDLQVRLTGAAHKFGVNFLNPGTRAAELHIQLYSFRLAGESRPMFTLRSTDGVWFDCFEEQVEGMWRDAMVADLERWAR